MILTVIAGIFFDMFFFEIQAENAFFFFFKNLMFLLWMNKDMTKWEFVTDDASILKAYNKFH